MVHIRNAERKDAKLLLQLILEMGQQERMEVFITEESLAEDGFGPAPKFRALIAEVDGRVAGYALFFDCYSSFKGTGLFLEDLFVRDDFRGAGVGKVLLSHIAAKAIELGRLGIMFNVLDWNQPALQFFQKAGATLLTGRNTLSLAGDALRQIAKHESAAAI